MPDELLRKQHQVGPLARLDAADVLVFPTDASDAEMFAEIDTIAELIGSAASDADSPRGHYSAVRNFGPMHYRAVAIPHSARDNEGVE